MKKIGLYLVFFISTFQCLCQTAESAYKTGMLLKANKNSVAAIVDFKKALELDPTSYKSMYELGWCYNDTKNYNAALEMLKKVRPYWSNIPKVFFELGYAYDKTNQKDSAKANYYNCLALKPDYKLAFKQLGYIEYEMNKNAEALSFINKYIALEPEGGKDYLVWYRKGFTENALIKYDSAIVSLQKSLLYKKDYINTYLELGYAYSKLKQAYIAINYFKEANKLDSKNHIPYNGIGEVYRDVLKNTDSAMYWYGESLKVKPKERKACFGMGYCLNAKGRYSEAIPYLETAIAQEPSYTAAYVELGYAQFKIGKYDEALRNFDYAIKLEAKNQNARYYKGLLYIAQKNKLKAQQMVDELKLLNSKNTQMLQEKVQKM